MKATEQYFPVVLFVMMHKVVLPFGTVVEILWCDFFQMNTLHQYFHIVLLVYQRYTYNMKV